MRRAGSGTRWLLWLSVLLVLAGCSSAPPPPLEPPPPPPPANPGDPTDGSRQLVVGLDDLGPGFNPHLISDLSPASTAVDSLVLPSVFRPGPAGKPALDPTVASSAKVTSTAPFTVSYELNLAAAWSDNTPIAAEDFVYLWQRMRSEPGVVDNAGYRLITDVRSRAGGKAVDVVFAQPYAQWQKLFSDLLPAHLLKDAPNGWSTALADSIPVSGGPFAVTSVDRAKGQLVLARNDHYWSTPAVLDSLVLRRLDSASMVDGLRSGDLGVAQTWSDGKVADALRQLGASVRLQPVPEPMVVQLGMRTDRGVLSDLHLRQAVGALLNRDALISIGTGNGFGGVPADAQLMAPSEPGYHPTAPAGAPIHQDPALAAQLLSTAGYAKDEQGRWARHGQPLNVVVGTPTDRPRFTAIAEEVRTELAAAGIGATVVTAPGSALYTDPTVVPSPPTIRPSPSNLPPGPGGATGSGRPDAGATGPAPPVHLTPTPEQAPPARPGGRTPAPPGPGPQAAGGSAPASGGSAPASGGSAGPSSTPASPSSPTATPAGVAVDLQVMPRAIGDDLATTAASNYGCPPGMAGVAQPARNSTGFCLPSLQPVLDSALAGGLSPQQADSTIETTLWQQLPAIPLFQMVTTLVSNPDGDKATGGIGPGPLTIGPFGTAPTWQPLAR